jgi:hypothetical protein
MISRDIESRRKWNLDTELETEEDVPVHFYYDLHFKVWALFMFIFVFDVI